jgi:hemerythrin-like domain-containing protein
MKEVLNKGIKEIIQKYPEIEKILDEYEIGCAPCGVGTCLLKDIVEIHNLSVKDENALMVRIARVIYPGRDIEIPKRKRKTTSTEQIKYSPPIKKLVNEHSFIKKLLALVPEIIKDLDLESEEGRNLILKSVEFIRNYADRYHHAKEEEILFKYFDESLDILKIMLDDHETGRAHVKAVIDRIDKKDKSIVAEHLNGYRELLTEHIKKEDEILYPWMDRNLDINQVGELYSKFNVVEEEFMDVPRGYEEFIIKIEEKYKVKEENKKEILR